MPPVRPAAAPATTRLPPWRAVLVVAGLAAVALACGAGVRDTGVLLADHALPWPVLLALLAVSDATVVEVQVRRETRLVTVSDVPVVLGLFLVAPLTLLLVRAASLALHYGAVRRQSPFKAAVNVVVGLAECGLAVVVLRAAVETAQRPDAAAWLAAYGALLVGGVVSAASVVLVIGLCADGVRRQDLRLAVWSAALGCLLTGTLGLLAVTSLVADRRTAVPLVAAAAAGVVACRRHAGLAEQHRSLERLYGAGQAVAAAREVDDVVVSVLAEACALLGAGRADLVLLPGAAAGAGLRLSYDGVDLVPCDAPEAEQAGWLQRRLAGGQALIVSATSEPEARDYLADRGVDEVLVAPLQGATGVFGALVVSDRLGSIRRFAAADAALLQQMAEQAAVALEHGRLRERLRHEARHDALTGLANRAGCLAALAVELERVRSGHSGGVGLLLTDLDGFKDVNDTHGHHHGDLLLREVGRRLAATAPPGALVARLGGDEFAVVLPGVVEAERAVAVARTLLDAVARPVLLEGVRLAVRGSTGVALAPEHASDRGGLLRCADAAMYAAKAAGSGVAVSGAPVPAPAGEDIR